MTTTIGSLLDIMALRLLETDRTLSSGLWTQEEAVYAIASFDQAFIHATGVVKKAGAVTGEIDTGTYPEPPDSSDVERVSYNGRKLYPQSRFELDRQKSTWRADSARNVRRFHRDSLPEKQFTVWPKPAAEGTGWTVQNRVGTVRAISYSNIPPPIVAPSSVMQRYSAMNIKSPWRRICCVPDGSTDRAVGLLLYSGIDPVTVSPPVYAQSGPAQRLSSMNIRSPWRRLATVPGAVGNRQSASIRMYAGIDGGEPVVLPGTASQRASAMNIKSPWRRMTSVPGVASRVTEGLRMYSGLPASVPEGPDEPDVPVAGRFGIIRTIHGDADGANVFVGYWPDTRAATFGGVFRQLRTTSTNFLVLQDVIGPAQINVFDHLYTPDAFARYVMYGALGRLWSKQGDGQDLNRARYCQERYERGVALTRRLVYGDVQQESMV